MENENQSIAPAPVPVPPAEGEARPDGRQVPEPLTSPTPSPEALSSVTSAISKLKNLPLSGVIAALVLLVGGGALAYVYYPASPEKVLAKMFAQTALVTSAEFSGKIELTANAPGGLLGSDGAGTRQIQGALEISGASDSSDLDNPKFYSFIKISGEGLVISADLRMLDKTVYLRLNEAPFLGFFDAGSIMDQWIKFDLSELLEQLEQVEASGAQLTKEQEEKIKQVLTEAQFIKYQEKLSSENLDGVSTHHYTFAIDKEQLIQFILKLGEISGDLTASEAQSFLDESLGSVEFSDGEIWIGKKDNLPYRVKLTTNFSNPADSETSGRISWLMDFRNHNKPVAVEASSNARDFSEIFGSGFGLPQPMVEIPDQGLDLESN